MPDYLITVSTGKQPDDSVTERLVRAKNEARALAHVVADTVKVERATMDDAIRLSKAGVELEQAE